MPSFVQESVSLMEKGFNNPTGKARQESASHNAQEHIGEMPVHDDFNSSSMILAQWFF
jgi:hypothetical protein